MRKKKEQKTKKEVEQPEEKFEEPRKDIKLGEFKLNDFAVLVIKKTNYAGQDRIDFRVWLNSPKYKGPTKQGFVLTMDKVDDFVDAINNIKKKIGEQK